MGWKDLVAEPGEGFAVFPWLGGRKIHRHGRTWRVIGKLPQEFGWYTFSFAEGRSAALVLIGTEPVKTSPDSEYWTGLTHTSGYVIGDRFIPQKARVDPDPDKLVEQTVPIYLLEPGLNRFSFVEAIFDPENRLIYTQPLFSSMADEMVRWAFVEKKESVNDIPGVTPPLDLAFRFACQQRRLLEERRAERERQRLERERLEQARKNLGTSLGRRTLAQTDFEAAARAALAAGNAEFLDCRKGHGKREMVVQYRFSNRRLECVVDRATLQVVDSGICLTDHNTGEKGDTYFTLESLPGVVRQASREGKLVVYRHVGGGGHPDDDDWED